MSLNINNSSSYIGKKRYKDNDYDTRNHRESNFDNFNKHRDGFRDGFREDGEIANYYRRDNNLYKDNTSNYMENRRRNTQHNDRNNYKEDNDYYNKNGNYQKYPKEENYSKSNTYRNNDRNHHEPEFYSRRDEPKHNFDQDEPKRRFYKKRSPSPYKNKKIENSDDENHSGPMKNYNFLILLPNNYHRFINSEFKYLNSELKEHAKNLDQFDFDYRIKGIQENILKIEAEKITTKATALNIVCDLIYDCMKDVYKTMYYLKISIVVPSHVAGFIIGVEGKNINSIRDISKAKVEVFSKDLVEGLREIEIQGSPVEITIAAEKIYKTVNKYYYYNNTDKRGSLSKKVRQDVGGKRNTEVTKPTKLSRSRSQSRLRSRSKSKSRSKSRSKSKSKSLSRKKSEIYESDSRNDYKHKNDTEDKPNIKYHLSTKEEKEEHKIFIEETNKECENNHMNLPKTNFSFIISNEDLNKLLKNTQSNIFIELENKFNCAIDKRKETISNKEVNIVTVSGTYYQTTMIVHSLLKLMQGISDNI